MKKVFSLLTVFGLVVLLSGCGGGGGGSKRSTPLPTPTATATPASGQLTVIAASADDGKGNVKENVLDGNLNTRFSTDSTQNGGAFITVDRGEAKEISEVKIAWYKGETGRVNSFEIYTSLDNITFDKAYPAGEGRGSSSGTSLALETYSFVPRMARYLKIVGYGYTPEASNSMFTSITEIEAWGLGGDAPEPTPTPTPDVTPSPTGLPDGGTTHTVTNSSSWTTAMNNLRAGDTVVVTGTYTSGLSIKNKIATPEKPITIRPQSTLGTTLYSLTVENCENITVEGFKFGPSAAGTLLKITNSKHIKVLKNLFDHNNISNSQSSIVTTQASQYIEVAYNTFDNKNKGTVSGSYIKTQFDNPNITKNMHIHHNYFKNIVPMPSGGSFDGDSDRETIVLGISSSQDIMTDHIIEYNLFEDCDGENEIITVKTSRNIIRYNTFKNCLGSVSVRFGTQTEVYGNYFFGEGASATMTDPNYETGGIRVYGSYHKIYNNYMQNLTGAGYRAPLCIDGGDTSDSSGGDGHERPTNCQVVYNTIVNCAWGLEVGTHYTQSPQNNKIANNVITGSQNKLFNLDKCDSTNIFEGNIAYPTGSATLGVSKTQAEVWNTNPLLDDVVANGYTIKKLSATSPAIGYALGTYSFVSDDINGDSRGSDPDSGADEYSAAFTGRLPLSSSDVGPNAAP